MTIGDTCADLGARQPVKPSHCARLVTVDGPGEESELEFWRRKAAERATKLTAERAKNQRLTLEILALLEREA